MKFCRDNGTVSEGLIDQVRSYRNTRHCKILVSHGCQTGSLYWVWTLMLVIVLCNTYQRYTSYEVNSSPPGATYICHGTGSSLMMASNQMMTSHQITSKGTNFNGKIKITNLHCRNCAQICGLLLCHQLLMGENWLREIQNSFFFLNPYTLCREVPYQTAILANRSSTTNMFSGTFLHPRMAESLK